MMHLSTLLLVLVLIAFSEELIRVDQDPANGTFCEGTTARLSCIIFDNSTGRAANTTTWLNNTAIDSISDDRVKNIVDGNNVTSVLTLMDVSKDLNNSNYSCRPTRTIISSGAVITIIVPPATAPILTEPFKLMNISFTINWTITNPNNIHSYIITWTNLHNDDMDNIVVQGNIYSYEVTGLNGVDNYNVSVTAENQCGMMESDPITVYDEPDAPTNVRILPEDIKSDSFIVQWDAVTDLFPIIYTVQWYGEDIDNTATTNGLSYTITGLTSNTSYSVTVVANNTCCEAGPVSKVVMVITTSTSPPTDPTVSKNGDENDSNVVPIVVSIVVVVVLAIIIIIGIVYWRRGIICKQCSKASTTTPPDETPMESLGNNDRSIQLTVTPTDNPDNINSARSTPTPNTSEDQQPSSVEQQPLLWNQEPPPLQPPARTSGLHNNTTPSNLFDLAGESISQHGIIPMQTSSVPGSNVNVFRQSILTEEMEIDSTGKTLYRCNSDSRMEIRVDSKVRKKTEKHNEYYKIL